MKKTFNKKIVILLILGIICVISTFISLGIGTIKFNLGQIVKGLFISDQSLERLIIFQTRLPRILVGGLIGVSLALVGCILQCVLHNELASSSTIGVSSGASFMGYMLLVVFPSLSYLLPLATIIGALIMTLIIYLLAYNKGTSPLKMILAGLAISTFLGAINDFIKTFFASDIGNVSGFLVGGLNGVSWQSFFTFLPFVLLAVVFILIIPNKLNILALGDDLAKSLGMNVQLFRFILLVFSAILAGSAIAFGGIIGFVGLIVPHIARLLVGNDYKYSSIASIFLGFSLVVISDSIGRIILPSSEVPVSIILAFIGVPFFLFLLRRPKK